MEASLTLILISPCIFIMAPRVTPARCMKCPASCHPRPLSFYLRNSSLLPSLRSPSLQFSLSFTPTYSGPLGDTNACSRHINMIYCCSQEWAVLFIFFSLSLSLLCLHSVLPLFLVPCVLFFSQILYISVSLSSKKYRANDLEIGMQVNLCPKKHPASHVSTPALPR